MLRPDWRRWMPPGFELAERREAERKRVVLLLREAREAAWEAAQETDAESLARLRREIASLKFSLAIRRYARKYSPEQPRVPAEMPEVDGGRARVVAAGPRHVRDLQELL